MEEKYSSIRSVNNSRANSIEKEMEKSGGNKKTVEQFTILPYEDLHQNNYASKYNRTK
jgi:hypothetical protein